MGRFRVILLGVAALVTAAAAPSAAGAGQRAPVVELDVLSAPPGARVTAKGSGFEAAGTLALFLDEVVAGGQLASTTLRSTEFTLTFTVPDVPAGRHSVIACREPLRTGECRQVARAQLDVTRRVPPTTTNRPPSEDGHPTTTAPPTIPGQVIGSTTAPTTTLPGGFGNATTTVEGSPPAPTGPTGFGATTTLATPGGLSPNQSGAIENLAITDVEVTQGLQNLDNEFPLVSKRRTTLRVHGTSADPDGQSGVAAAVAGFRISGGEEVPLGLEFSENFASFDDGLHRETHAYSPYIELPWSWAEGTVKLRVWVFAGEILAGNEPDDSDNLREVVVTFEPSASVHMWYWPLYLTQGYDPDGDPLIWTAGDGYLQEHLFTYRIWPVTTLFPHPMNTVVGDASSDWNLDEHPGEVNVALQELWETAGHVGENQYVGMVHQDLGDITTFGGFAGSSGGVATWTVMGNAWANSWYHPSGATLAHEGAHAYGLLHAPCLIEDNTIEPGEDGGGPVDPLFPGSYGWPQCSLAPTDARGYYGLDVNWELGQASGPRILSNNPLDANAAFPMMSYKKPRWLDPWHGCLLIDVFGVDCVQDEVVPIDPSGPNQGSIPTGTSGGIPKWTCHDVISDVDMCQILPNPDGNPTADDDGGTTATDDWIVVGAVNPEDGTGLLRRALTVPAAEPDSPAAVEPGEGPGLTGNPAAGGPYVLAAVDADGAAVWATTVDVDDEPSSDAAHAAAPDHGAGPDSERWFVERVPHVPGAARLVLTSPEGDLAELGPSPSAPTLRIARAEVGDEVLAIEVDAGDPDGGPVWVSASYRPSPEAAWSPLVASTTTTAFDIDLNDLAGSDRGEVRMLATDGFRTVEAVVGGLAVPDQAPVVTIVTPTPGRQRPAGRTLDLVAVAYDNEDGDLGDTSAVEWSSDVDGVVGEGAATEVRDLSEGRHVLTVTATDSAGNAGLASVEVVVGASDLPSAGDQAALAAVLAAGPSDDRGSSAPAVALAVGVAVVGGAAGAFAVRRRRSDPDGAAS